MPEDVQFIDIYQCSDDRAYAAISDELQHVELSLEHQKLRHLSALLGQVVRELDAGLGENSSEEEDQTELAKLQAAQDFVIAGRNLLDELAGKVRWLEDA